jgi:hypothetical protein
MGQHLIVRLPIPVVAPRAAAALGTLAAIALAALARAAESAITYATRANTNASASA